MAPNKRGGPPSFAANSVQCRPLRDGESAISASEVAARGTGSKDSVDIYQTLPWPHNEIRVGFTGLMFLTRLPCPKWCDHHAALLMRSTAYFPLIGALVGAWAAVFYNAAAIVWQPGIAVALCTLSTVWLTGCFHEDGLADTFDGFGGGWGRNQILRIMKDSRVGTYALVGMWLVMWLKTQALSCMPQDSVPGVLIAVHSASRWSSMALIYACEYVQDEEDAKGGLYNWFAQSRLLLTPLRLMLGTFTAVLVPCVVLPAPSALCVLCTVTCLTVGAGCYGNAIIGGVIGDYLGATIQVCEVGCYLALCADISALATHWRPLITLAITAALPVMYSRQIVDWGKATPC